MMTNKLILSVLSAAIVAIATGAPAANADADPGNFEIEVEAGLLTVEARDAPLFEIVRAIGEQAEFETVMIDEIATPMSVSFTALSIEDALERLLRGVDWVVVYGPPQQGTTGRVIARLLVFESTGDAVESAASAGEAGAAADGPAGTAGPALPDDAQHADARDRARDMLRLVNSGATPEVLATLTGALQGDDDAWVRGRAATALGALRDERAVSDLLRSLADGNASVRMQAVQALGQIGGDRAIWGLGEVLLYGATSMERIQAAWALGRQDGELARLLLDAAAGDPSDLVWRASQTPPGRAHGRSVELPADAERRGIDSIR